MRPQGIPPDMASLFGSIILGLLFSTLLFGAFLVQMIIYFLHFPNDCIHFKALVSAVAIFETVLTALLMHGAWWHFASGWGDLEVLSAVPWSFTAFIPFSGLVFMIVQCFFSWRLRMLGYSAWKIPHMIVALGVLQWAASFPTGLTTQKLGLTNGIPTSFHSVLTYGMLWLLSNVICDGIIMVTMLHFLFKASSDGNQPTTQSTLMKLISITVASGMMTTAASVASLVFFAVVPRTNLCIFILLMLSKIYSNTLMAQLNARKFIVATESSSHVPSIFWENFQVPMDMRTNQTQGLRISNIAQAPTVLSIIVTDVSSRHSDSHPSPERASSETRKGESSPPSLRHNDRRSLA